MLVEEGFTVAREHEIESLFTVANGYVGTRGSLAEGSPFSASATFIAGVFYVPPDSQVPELVVAPDWLRLRAVVDGSELRLENGYVLEHRRVLDLRQGILWREWRQRDPAGRLTLVQGLRLASLADRHVLLQSVAFTPENYGGRVLMETSIEEPAGALDPSPNLAPSVAPSLMAVPEGTAPTAGPPDATSTPLRPAVFSLHIAGTGVELGFASAGSITTVGGDSSPTVLERDEGGTRRSLMVDMEIGQSYRLDRVVFIFTSRETVRPSDVAAARAEQLFAQDGSADGIVAAHVRAWAARWSTADVEIEGDDLAQRALRFAIYHLISASNPEDETVSVAARALTGPAYKGHVFWDTETFMMPFYIFTAPPSARALLMYRYHTLPAARSNAEALGYRGALYPWEAADTGAETTPHLGWFPDGTIVEILTGEQEHHISADVAYAVWQYWQATGDDVFMLAAGAEILIETARFWASRGTLGADGKYHIYRVIGPDEYHESVDDDAYTNLMAQWNLERGAEVVRLLETRWPDRWRVLSETLALTAEEVHEWKRLAEVMYTGFDPESGLYEQFAGYFDLAEIDLAAYEPRMVPIDVLLGRERIQSSKVIKQADVIMALYLLWDHLPARVREANFRYYEPRTGHGSSLSPAIHALVAARLGDRALATRYFRQTADIDLANNMGSAAGGVHAAALGGLWQAVVFGFAGVQLHAEGLIMDPHLPSEWSSLRFPLQWRGRTLEVTVTAEPLRVEVQLEGDDNVSLTLAGGPAAVIAPGRTYASELTPGGWRDWQEVGA